MTSTFDRLRHVLHEDLPDKRVKYMIEVMFQVKKDWFKINSTTIFFDTDYEANAKKIPSCKRIIGGEGDSPQGSDGNASEEEEENVFCFYYFLDLFFQVYNSQFNSSSIVVV